MRALAILLLVTGCSTLPDPADPAPAAFYARLQRLCGKAYEGRIVSTDAADADMRGKRLVMHMRACSDDEVRIPFHVGDDRSRTWVVGAGKIISDDRSRRAPARWLTLKHDHRHADGSADVLTGYGGESFQGTTRYEFPADDFSKALFRTRGNPASSANVWALELEPGRRFAYELRRQARFFRVEFDLTKRVPAPPSPRGAR